MQDIDSFMVDAVTRDTIDIGAKPTDHFSTAGSLEFDNNAQWRIRSGHTIDFNGATLELDVDRVTDEMLLTQQAIMMIPSEINNIQGKTGEDAWSAVSTHECVKNVNLVANYSKLIARAKALGVKQFAIEGIGLQGHDAQISGVTCSDFGAYGRECFPVWVTGADSGYDLAVLYGVDLKHQFDEDTNSSSAEYSFDSFVPALSNAQVTVGSIMGAVCPANHVDSPWSQSGPWRQIWRRDATLKYNVTASGQNYVQGGTIYLAKKGTVDGRTQGARVGYYTDYYKSKGIHILPSCSFKGGTYGVAILLSPKADGAQDQVDWFTAEDFIIEKFDCDARLADVYLDATLPNTADRYIKNIAVDERLRIINEGMRAGVVLIPGPATKKTGCRKFI